MAFTFKRKTKKIKLAGGYPSWAEMDRRLIALWRQIVFNNFSNRCAYCGTAVRLQAHHIFTKKNRGTRWLPKNGICLCAGHHKFLAHDEPEKFRRFLIESGIMPEVEYNDLYIKAHAVTKFTIPELLILEEAMKKQIGGEDGKYAD